MGTFISRYLRWGVCLLLVCAARVDAATVTLAWDPSPSSDVAGYRLMFGNSSGLYTTQVDVVGSTQHTLNLPDGTYYFVVRAFSVDGLTSAPSNEVVAFVGTIVTPPPGPSPIPGGCTTPDPFASLGGGTCANGGWLPPTYVPPPPPPPAPTPSPVPAPAPSPGGCTTPDPFMSLGGGTCSNGGWLPPTYVAPAPAPAPAPTPAPSPAPAPAPPGTCTTSDPFASLGGGTCTNGGWLPPSTVTPPPAPSLAPGPGPAPTPAPGPTGVCTTSDPFTSLGGGTCHNGGWLPPGIPVPGGTPPPAPAPGTPPVSDGTCTTPDPFTSLGGGTCLNGGWLPPGMTPPSLELVVDISATGVIRRDAATGQWFIEGDDDRLFMSPSEFPEELLIEGTRVSFQGRLVSEATPDDIYTVVEIQTLVIIQ